MSKKSGLFYKMIALLFYKMIAFLGFGGMLMQPIPELKYEDERKESRSNRHRFRTFGKEITSFGTKPDYGHLPRKRFYQEKIDARRRKHYDLVRTIGNYGIVWTPTGLYWKDRITALAHKNDRVFIVQ